MQSQYTYVASDRRRCVCVSRVSDLRLLAPEPTPIGGGSEYHPRPAVHAACAPAPLRTGRLVHLELFANGRVIVVPAGIGVLGDTRVSGRIVGARCRAPIWTLDPTGVVHLVAPARLGSVFAVWGRTLAPARLLAFRGAVRVYRNGARWRGDPRSLPLREHDQIVLQVGAHVPPHRTYRFPRH